MAPKPFKSESMGLLDAEGYKFLEASDSNSDHEDDDGIVMDHIADAAGATDSHEPSSSDIIYEMRPAPIPK